MTVEASLARARQAWIDLADAPVSFIRGGIDVRASADSGLCPPGWAGVVQLGGAAIVTVPSDDLVPVVGRALAGLPAESATDADILRTRLSVADILGPATLAYTDESDFLPAAGSIERLPAGDGELARLRASMAPEEAQESAITDITSAAFVIRDGPAVVAAAGYRRWPGSIAHTSVLTAAAHRGRGLARIVASAAVGDALRHGLLPQWRARVPASLRVAEVLGFHRLGSQLSFRLN